MSQRPGPCRVRYLHGSSLFERFLPFISLETWQLTLESSDWQCSLRNCGLVEPAGGDLRIWCSKMVKSHVPKQLQALQSHTQTWDVRALTANVSTGPCSRAPLPVALVRLRLMTGRRATPSLDQRAKERRTMGTKELKGRSRGNPRGSQQNPRETQAI